MEPKKSRFILSRSQSVCITHAVRTWAVDCFLLNLFPVLWRVPTARHGNFKKMCQMNEFLENKKRLCISPKPPVSNISFPLYWKDLLWLKKKKKSKFESLGLRRIFSLFQIKISLTTKNLTLILGMDIKISRSIGCQGLQTAGSHSSSRQQQWNTLLSLSLSGAHNLTGS